MVLKGIIRYIINRYLKNYIEQLDDEKLNFDLKNGFVKLENLRLKPEALADLNLPVTVATGCIEQLSLTVPWMSLSTNPTRIHIRGLYMLIVPKNEVERDLTEYHANKMRRVQRKVDNLRKAMIENKKLEEKESTFFERMRVQIMHNIEVTLENFHLAYETISTTKLGHPFSFGVTFSYLRLTTVVDSHAKRRNKEIIPIVYQISKVEFVSTYWNTKCRSRVGMPFEVVVNDLKSKVASMNNPIDSQEMNYILYPATLCPNLVVTIRSAEENFQRPTFDVKMNMEELHLQIDSKQFSDLLDFGKFHNYTMLYERCREYRQLHLQDAVDPTTLTNEQRDRIRALETKMDVFNLSYIRHSVELEIQHRRESSTSDGNAHRWNWWWKQKGKHASGTSSHSHLERRASSTRVEDYPHDGFSLYLEDISNLNINLEVVKLSCDLVSPLVPTDTRTSSRHRSLRNGTREIITRVHLSHIQTEVVKRSISSSLLLLFNVPSLQLYAMNGNNGQPSLLVQGKSNSPSPSPPMIHIKFELFPRNNSQSDYGFHVIFQPISIVYDAPMFNRIVECFDPNENSTLNVVPATKSRTAEEMEDDLAHLKMFDLTIELSDLSIVFPSDGVSNRPTPLMDIRFDRAIFKSSLETKTYESRFYFKYKFAINNLQVKYSSSDGSSFDILQRIPLVDMTFFKCIYFDDAILNDWNIFVKVNELHLFETEKFIEHLSTIPRLNATLSEILFRINTYFDVFRMNTSLQGSVSVARSSMVNSTGVIGSRGLSVAISKSRSKLEQIRIIFERLSMATTKSSKSFYRRRPLRLNYIDNYVEF